MMETLLTVTHLCILFAATQLVCFWDCVKCVKYVQMKIMEKLNICGPFKMFYKRQGWQGFG